jgi:hypothetical protein
VLTSYLHDTFWPPVDLHDHDEEDGDGDGRTPKADSADADAAGVVHEGVHHVNLSSPEEIKGQFTAFVSATI